MSGISNASKSECWTLGRRNNALFYLIFSSIFVFIGSTEASSNKSSNGHCIWYGECVSPWFGSHKNCLTDMKAKPLNDKGVTLLSKHCPDYIIKDSEGRINTCCDTDQLKTMDNSLWKLASTMRGCDACLKNIKKHICELTCSPHQSDFMDVTNVKRNEQGEKYVDGIEIYITNKYIEGTLESCREVKIGWFFNFLDQIWQNSHDRTALSFFNSIGRKAPFDMTYINWNSTMDKFKPLNPNVTSC